MDPYRLLFPLGAIIAVLGTVFWIPFGFGALNSYPGVFHADLMIGGFLFAFAEGFLMTAVPQFTASLKCRAWELAFAVLGVIVLCAFGFSASRFPFHVCSAVLLAGLVAFCAFRFIKRTFEPPPFFAFVGLGLAMGILGATLLALCDATILDGSWRTLGRSIYEQGMMLSLTLGVGTHLLPAIWEFKELPGAGWLIRALLTSYLAVRHWWIWRKPKARGKLAAWLWISAWTFVIGTWLPVFAPVYAVHGLHLLFIGGFGLMTFLIAGRVTLAHGGYGHRVELRSRLLTAVAILILLSAITRVIAPLAPSAYLHHLTYAALLWIIAVLCWSLVFIPRAVRLKENPIAHRP